ncbi:MAG: hypothetical protein FWF81_05670, partial [Defluviitaleaceae bacterium]|nr:hypothetical protein [Defluviitaleaceae bacterium]
VGFARVAWASSLQLAANDQPTVARGFGGVAPIYKKRLRRFFAARSAVRRQRRRSVSGLCPL